MLINFVKFCVSLFTYSAWNFWRPRPFNYFHFRLLYVFWSNSNIAESCFTDWKNFRPLNHWFVGVLYLLANLGGNMYVWLTVWNFEITLHCSFLKRYKKNMSKFVIDWSYMLSKDVSILYICMFNFWIKFWKIDHCAIYARKQQFCRLRAAQYGKL